MQSNGPKALKHPTVNNINYWFFDVIEHSPVEIDYSLSYVVYQLLRQLVN